MRANSLTSKPRIVVLGAGFGGLFTTLRLEQKLKRARISANITLLDKNNFFLFSPLLHEMTAEMVEMHHVVHPIRQLLRKTSVHFQETTIKSIDLNARVIHTTLGETPYDYLVMAMGSVTHYFEKPNLLRFTFPLKGLGEAVRLRNHIISQFEIASQVTDPIARQQLLTFVQVGAGYTGLETITDMHDLIHRSLLRDYRSIHSDEVRIILVDASPTLRVPNHTGLARYTLNVLQRKGIELRFDMRVNDAGPGWLELTTGERIATKTVVWTAGVTTNPVIAALPVQKGAQQRVMVRDTLQLLDFPEVFALGDCAFSSCRQGQALPTTAQVADQQAKVTAANVLRLCTNKPLRPFTYLQLGQLASLGTYNAIADIGPFKFHGFFAWWLWRTVYLLKMPWWSDRLRIAADWTLDLFFPLDTSRIEVIPSSHCPFADCDGQVCQLQSCTRDTEDENLR